MKFHKGVYSGLICLNTRSLQDQNISKDSGGRSKNRIKTVRQVLRQKFEVMILVMPKQEAEQKSEWFFGVFFYSKFKK